ncbi:MAG: hypothetical protein K2J68_07245 [Treponemataceae bacterium]|nr:hypothetical protein [Treponemataceae bacterium]
MKKYFLSLFAAIALFSAFAQDRAFDEVSFGMDGFALSLEKTLPNAAVQQNVYADAWIGKFFPSAPPHFGIGAEFGVTKFDLSPLKGVANIFGISAIPKTFIFPTFTANARIGGLILPFDVGLSFMYIDLSKLRLIDGIGVNYFNVGGDFRWAIFKGEGAFPKLSVGGGFYLTKGGFSFEKDGFDTSLDYCVKTVFFSAQISKKFIFFTPYAGFRGIFSDSDIKWNWQVTSELASASKYNGTLSASGTKSSGFFDSFIPQVFGGFGLDISMMALNFGASWDFKNSIWAADVSIRFQL